MSMLRFIADSAAPPRKRSVRTRVKDFQECYKPFETAGAEGQSSRCAQCGVPFCQIHCPLHNNIPDWLMLAAGERLYEAWQVSSQTNILPEICGRICPQDRLCEGNCVIENAGHGAVTIGAIERHLTDTAWQNGWIRPMTPPVERPESVGIIGSGPGALAAAAVLRQNGLQVEIAEAQDRAGGLLCYGIPNFKLDKAIVKRRIDWLTQSGVRFLLNCHVGKTIGFAEFRNRHHAIILAMGVYKPRALGIDGAEHALPALEYLTASNRMGLGDNVPEFHSGRLDASGEKVVVIGGGDTAMDCVRTAIRQGAKSVHCLYRRDRHNMPGSQQEVGHALEEGIKFVWQTLPLAIKNAGRKQFGARPFALTTGKVRLGAPDASGRRTPEKNPTPSGMIPATMIISALGFEPERLPDGFPEVSLTEWGTLRVDMQTMQTNLPNIYAIGDIVRGASLVVWAVRDGMHAARAICSALLRRAA